MVDNRQSGRTGDIGWCESTPPAVVFSRYLGTGALDESFASGGSGALPAALGAFTQVAEDGRGRVVVVHTLTTELQVHRYTAAGVLDPSFGSGGEVSFDEGDAAGTGMELPGSRAIGILPDGRLLITLCDPSSSTGDQGALVALWD